MHTSTVTVAVLREPEEAEVALEPGDLDWSTHRGKTRAGGQHANKSDSAVRLVHRPSGIEVRVEGRHQHRNRALALQVLRARLLDRASSQRSASRNRDRRAMVGSGMRGDKRRTVSEPRGTVVDHVTGQQTTTRRYRAGFLADLA